MDTTKRRALGKGLEELFNNEQLDFNKIEEKIAFCPFCFVKCGKR